MPVIDARGVQLASTALGGGVPVLFLHDMGGSADDAPDIDGARMTAYDRRGYGASTAPEPYNATTVGEQTQDALAVLAALDCGAPLLCGSGFGALIALDLARCGATPLRGAALHNPPLLSLVPNAAEGLAADREAIEAALRADGAHAAVECWRRAPARPGAERGFFADFAGLATLSVRRAELRAIGLPIRVSWDEDAASHVRAAAAALLELLPAAARTPDLITGARELLGVV